MLGSGEGTTIDFFCQRIKTKELKVRVAALISDRKNSGVERVANRHQIPFYLVEYENSKRWEERFLRVISSFNPQFVLLAGFLRKIPASVISQFPQSIINSHPSLLPDFSGHGMYGLRVHQAVIQSQKKQTGVTIHLVDENWDSGPVIKQKTLTVLPQETALQLQERVKKIERELYLKTFSQIITGEIKLSEI